MGHPLPDKSHEDGIQDIVHLPEAEVEGVEFGRHVVLGVALLELAHTELRFLYRGASTSSMVRMAPRLP